MKKAKLVKTKVKSSKARKPYVKKIIMVIEAPITEEPIEIPKSVRILRIEKGK